MLSAHRCGTSRVKGSVDVTHVPTDCCGVSQFSIVVSVKYAGKRRHVGFAGTSRPSCVELGRECPGRMLATTDRQLNPEFQKVIQRTKRNSAEPNSA